MEAPLLEARGTRTRNACTALCFLVGCGGPFWATRGGGQERGSLSGETAAATLKATAQAEAEQYNLHWGPVDFRIGAKAEAGYTDNAFYTQTNRLNDYVISPEVDLTAFMQVSELNTLRLSVGLGYQYYVKNTELNPSAPLVNPDSELAFHLFVGNVHIRFHEKFTYEQTLFINTTPSGQDILFNFTDVGIFSRWDNLAGVDAVWDLDRVILTAGYNHENFVSSTSGFEYLNRASEWFSASAAYLLGDQARIGVESQASLHDYATETTLNDNWRVRVGPFVEVAPLEKITLRAGGGYDTAWYDPAGESSNFRTYYAYGRVAQETRFFTHSLSAGRESLLGDNANNLEDTYVRYAISTPLVEHVDIAANGAVHFDREQGGAFRESFTYYVAGLKVGYQFHKHWRAELGYQYMLKNSDLPFRGFYRNLATAGVTFSF